MASRILAALVLLTGWMGAPAARAQEVGPCPTPGATVDTAGRAPDLVIRASARAAEVRFGSQPEIDVRLRGCAVLDTVRVLERRNLPDPVQPNVTYRDVFVAVEILGHLDVTCLLPGLALRLCTPPAADSVPRAPPGR